MKSAEDRLHILSLLLHSLWHEKILQKSQEIHASDHTMCHFKCVFSLKKQQTSRQKDTNNSHRKK